MTTDVPIDDAAPAIRQILEFDVGSRGSASANALRLLADQAEELGILVMVNGVVGSNTSRKLDGDEFRGFALVDPYAPVVFVNGAAPRAAQLFTLVHELAHLWLGESALSDADLVTPPTEPVERWCDRVAAELLVPASDLNERYDPKAELSDELERLARVYKASTLVVARRLFDAGRVERDEYVTVFGDELERLASAAAGRSGGGNFYNTQPVRVSKRFARALLASTLQGQTGQGEAFRMLGFKKASTLNELARRMGVG
jgi:Zn-dependent peptidase ImmA (M78 family)